MEPWVGASSRCLSLGPFRSGQLLSLLQYYLHEPMHEPSSLPLHPSTSWQGLVSCPHPCSHLSLGVRRFFLRVPLALAARTCGCHAPLPETRLPHCLKKNDASSFW